MTQSKTVDVTLAEPVEFKGTSYPQLHLRRMKAKDLVASDLVKGEVRKGLAIIASMADVPLPVIEDLTIEDLEAVQSAAEPLMGNGARAAITAAREAEATPPSP